MSWGQFGWTIPRKTNKKENNRINKNKKMGWGNCQPYRHQENLILGKWEVMELRKKIGTRRDRNTYVIGGKILDGIFVMGRNRW